MVHGNVASPHAGLIAKAWSWEIHLACDSPISSWMRERILGFHQTDPAIPWCCLLPFCTTWSWDFAAGISHLFLLPADLPWQSDGLGWPRLCHRALARSCLLAGRDGHCPWCPAVSPTYTDSTWKNKLLPSPAHMAGVREQKWWKLHPEARESKARRTWNFSHQSQPMSQDHPLRWLQHNQHQERASSPEWFRAIKSGTN